MTYNVFSVTLNLIQLPTTAIARVCRVSCRCEGRHIIVNGDLRQLISKTLVGWLVLVHCAEHRGREP